MTLQKRLKEAKMVAEVISPTMLAVVSTLAVGTGVALKSSDDIYDIGRLFYDYVNTHNDLTWEVVKTTFESAKVFNDTILINSGILDITRGFFDSKFKNNNSDISFTYNGSLPYFQDFESVLKYSSSHYDFIGSDYYGKSFKSQGLDFKLKSVIDTSSVPYSSYEVYFGEEKLFKFTMYGGSSSYLKRKYTLYTYKYSNTETRIGLIRDGDVQNASCTRSNDDFLRIFGGVGTLPYNGGYNWDSNIEDKKEGTGDLPLPIPGNLGDLVGKNPSDVWDKNYENGLVGNGDITVPDVSNPSIGLGGSTSFPVEDNTDGSIDIEYNKTVWSNGDLITADKLNNIEDALEALCTTTENYIKTIWKDNDLITEEKLNKIENAIAVLSPSYEKTNWSNGDIIIAELLNKIENAIEAL